MKKIKELHADAGECITIRNRSDIASEQTEDRLASLEERLDILERNTEDDNHGRKTN